MGWVPSGLCLWISSRNLFNGQVLVDVVAQRQLTLGDEVGAVRLVRNFCNGQVLVDVVLQRQVALGDEVGAVRLVLVEKLKRLSLYVTHNAFVVVAFCFYVID